MSLGSIVVRLSMNTADFDTDSKRAASLAKKRAAEIDRAFTAAGRAIGLALGASLGIIALGTKNAIDRMDELAKSSQKVCVGTEELSKLAYAANLAGVDFGTLENALGKLAKSQDMAAQGSKEQLAVFQALGVAFQNADGTLRNTDKVLADIAAKFQGLPDGANKTAAAMALLGRSGATLIPLLNGGSDGLERMGDELESFGGVVGPEAARMAEEFNDNISRLQVAAEGLWISIASKLLPELVNLTDQMADGAKEGDGLKGVAEGISTSIAVMADTAYRAFGGIKALVNGFVELSAEAANFITTYSPAARLLDNIGTGGAIRRESRVLAETSAAGRTEGFDALTGGFAPGLGVYIDPVKEAREAADAAKLKEDANRELAKGLDLARTADERKAAAAKAAAAADREAAKAAAEAAKELEQIQKAGASALEGLGEQVRQNAADLAGPAAQAAKSYADELVNLIAKEGELRAANLLTAESEAMLALAREQAGEGYSRQIETIEKQRTSAEQMIEDLQFEASLRGLNNLEMETEIALRYAGAEATDEQRAAIARLLEEQDKARQVAEGMDVVRDATRGLFTDLMDGSKSASEAFKDFVSNILDGIAQIVAKNLTEQLLGSFGSTGGGASGGGLAALFGKFFGGALAGGGSMYAGKAYLVGERGPELVMPSSAGTVIPADRTAAMLGGRGASVTNNFMMPGRYDSRTQAQVAADSSRSIQRATSRSVA
jgi:hypothetical protein